MHTSFVTTTCGLDRESLPMRLFEKAKGGSLDEVNRVAQENEDA